MARTRSGAGDPASTVELLWRHRLDDPAPRRGPRPRHTVDDIVAAAVAIADTEGLEALTMRHLADRLGLSPMTLYGYVPGRAELVDLMLDAVYATMPRSDYGRRRWRVRLEQVAEENRLLCTAHPWVVEVATGRPTLGPGALAKYDHELAALDRTGLDDVTTDAALTLVLGFVTSACRAAQEARAVADESGRGEPQWWAAAGPVLARVIDASEFPLASRVGSAAGAVQGAAYDPDRAYRFGLHRILDGLAVLIERPSGGPRRRLTPAAG